MPITSAILGASAACAPDAIADINVQIKTFASALFSELATFLPKDGVGVLELMRIVSEGFKCSDILLRFASFRRLLIVALNKPTQSYSPIRWIVLFVNR